MLVKLSIACCLLVIVSARELPASLGLFNGRIVGGKDAERGEFPHQISLQTEVLGFMSHRCGGSILNKTWILTAAHCVVNLPPNRQLYIKAGRYLLKGSEKFEQISRVIHKIVHKNYPSTAVVAPFDIALLKIESPLVFNEFVQPIELPKQDEPVHGEVTLSGWGSTDPYGLNQPNRLQKMDVPIVDNESCKRNLHSLTGQRVPIDPTNVCTGPLIGGTSSCSGDSGGPLVKYINGKPRQVGIVSWGLSPCAKYTGAAVYTRVASFINWIDSNIARN